MVYIPRIRLIYLFQGLVEKFIRTNCQAIDAYRKNIYGSKKKIEI